LLDDRLLEKFDIKTPSTFKNKSNITSILNLYLDFLNSEISNNLNNILDIDYLNTHNLTSMKRILFQTHLNEVYDILTKLHLSDDILLKFKSVYKLFKLNFNNFNLDINTNQVIKSNDYIRSSKDYKTKKGTKTAFVFIDNILTLLDLQNINNLETTIEINSNEVYNYTIKSDSYKEIIEEVIVPLCHPVGFIWTSIKLLASEFEDHFGVNITKTLSSIILCDDIDLMSDSSEYGVYLDNYTLNDVHYIITSLYKIKIKKDIISFYSYDLNITNIKLVDPTKGILTVDYDNKNIIISPYTLTNSNNTYINIELEFNSLTYTISLFINKDFFNYKFYNNLVYSFSELFILTKEYYGFFSHNILCSVVFNYDISEESIIDDKLIVSSNHIAIDHINLNDVDGVQPVCYPWYIGSTFNIGEHNLNIQTHCSIQPVCYPWYIDSTFDIGEHNLNIQKYCSIQSLCYPWYIGSTFNIGENKLNIQKYCSIQYVCYPWSIDSTFDIGENNLNILKYCSIQSLCYPWYIGSTFNIGKNNLNIQKYCSLRSISYLNYTPYLVKIEQYLNYNSYWFIGEDNNIHDPNLNIGEDIDLYRLEGDSVDLDSIYHFVDNIIKPVDIHIDSYDRVMTDNINLNDVDRVQPVYYPWYIDSTFNIGEHNLNIQKYCSIQSTPYLVTIEQYLNHNSYWLIGEDNNIHDPNLNIGEDIDLYRLEGDSVDLDSIYQFIDNISIPIETISNNIYFNINSSSLSDNNSLFISDSEDVYPIISEVVDIKMERLVGNEMLEFNNWYINNSNTIGDNKLAINYKYL